MSDKSADKSARIVVRVRLVASLTGKTPRLDDRDLRERGSRRTRRYPRHDPRAEIGEDVRVGLMEFQLIGSPRVSVCPSTVGVLVYAV